MLPQQGFGMNRPTLPTVMQSNSMSGNAGVPGNIMRPSGSVPPSYALPVGYLGSAPLATMPMGTVTVQPNQSKLWSAGSQGSVKHQDVHNQQLQAQHQKDVKYRDYLKQQQRLKAMPLSSSKALSADALIGNLLEKKDTFILKQNLQMQNKQACDHSELFGQVPKVPQARQPGHVDQSSNASQVSSLSQNVSLPAWLIPNSPKLPPLYAHVWTLVADPTTGGSLVDTNKILSLLLTSGLPKEVLGFIWNLATCGANVQLNQQQLYILLALVALAQMGCAYNTLNVFNFIPAPPIPSFIMNTSKAGKDDKPKQTFDSSQPVFGESHSAAVITTAFSSTSLPPSKMSTPTTFAQSVSLPTEENEDEFGDEFTDFQSADVSGIPGSTAENLCSSIPATAVIQPSVAAKQVVNELNHSVVTKLARNQGRTIGSRLANHTLGAPRFNGGQKNRRSSVEHDNLFVQDEISFSFEQNQSHQQDLKGHSKQQQNSDSEDFNDFQVAEGLDVNVDELFPKCQPKPKSHDFELKESAIRNESDEDYSRKRKEFELLAFDSPTSSTPPEVELQSLPASNEVPFVAPPPSVKPAKELMSVEEDKYSALRLFELENVKGSAIEPSDSHVRNSNNDADDFGDFVSADDMFAEIAVRGTGDSAKTTAITAPVQLPTTSNDQFPVDDWGQSDQISLPYQQPQLLDAKPVSSKQNKIFDGLSSAFSDLNFTTGSCRPADRSNAESKCSPNFDFSKDSSSEDNNPIRIGDSSVNDDDFGDFIGPDNSSPNCKTSHAFFGDQLWGDSDTSKPVPSSVLDNKSVSSLELPGVSLSRHGSLPSLDLNLFPSVDEMNSKVLDSQVTDWVRCLNSSYSLLQAAGTTFTNITSHSVLMEVLGTAEGKNYLSNLLEVHRVTWRIQRSYLHSGHESSQMDSILGSIQKIWATLQTFYKLANIESAVEKDGSDEESGQPACGVCGSPASRGVLEYGGHVYHAPCANLWLNCVDRTLPSHSPLL